MKFYATLLLSTLALAAYAPASSSAASQYVAYSSHTDSSCSSVPKQVAYIASSDCSTTSTATCVADSSSGLYLSQSCVADVTKQTTTVFASEPWILFEIYKPSSNCATLASAVGYLADGSCLSVDNATSSVIAKVLTDKSATVTTYDGTSCSGTGTKTNAIAASDLSRTTCLQGLFLASTSSATTGVTAQSSDAAAGLAGSLQTAALALAVAAAAIL